MTVKTWVIIRQQRGTMSGRAREPSGEPCKTRWAIPTLTLLFASVAANAQPFTSCAVSAAQFAQLHVGLTYAEVIAVIGCAGEVMVDHSAGRPPTMMYGWQGHGIPGANMNAMFQDGRLTMKRQFGIR
jgi:hypothetical protein